MKYRLLIFGLFFLINPYFWVIDIIPDFIGLLLIAKAIKPASDVSPSAESAVLAFKKAAAVSIAQIGLLIPMIPIVNTDPTFNMVFSFCFNVLRLIFLIPAFRDLFNCMIYFAEKHAVFGHSVSTARIRFTKAATHIFVILHCFLSSFPEIVYFKIDDSGFAENVYPLAYYRTGVIFLAGAIALVIGLIWYVIVCAQFSSLRKSAVMNEGIAKDIASAVRSEKKRIMSAIRPAVICFTLSSFCMISYFIDGRAVIPPYFAPILHIATIAYLGRILDKKVTKAFSIAATVLAFPLHLFYEMFASNCHDRALFAFNDVKDQFSLPYWSNIIYTAFLILSLICVGIAFHRAIDKHTGLFWESAFITHNSRAARHKLHQKQLSILLTFFGCLCAVINTLSYSYLYKKPTYNLYASFICIAFAVAGALLYSSVKTSVLEKYSTENQMN